MSPQGWIFFVVLLRHHVNSNKFHTDNIRINRRGQTERLERESAGSLINESEIVNKDDLAQHTMSANFSETTGRCQAKVDGSSGVDKTSGCITYTRTYPWCHCEDEDHDVLCNGNVVSDGARFLVERPKSSTSRTIFDDADCNGVKPACKVDEWKDRRANEKDFVLSNDIGKKEYGKVEHYVVATAWLDRWKTFLAGKALPGPIENLNIYDLIYNHELESGKKRLRLPVDRRTALPEYVPYKDARKDYHYLGSEVWNYLKGIYTCDLELKTMPLASTEFKHLNTWSVDTTLPWIKQRAQKEAIAQAAKQKAEDDRNAEIAEAARIKQYKARLNTLVDGQPVKESNWYRFKAAMPGLAGADKNLQNGDFVKILEYKSNHGRTYNEWMVGTLRGSSVMTKREWQGGSRIKWHTERVSEDVLHGPVPPETVLEELPYDERQFWRA